MRIRPIVHRLAPALALALSTAMAPSWAGATESNSDRATAQGTSFIRGEVGYTFDFDSDVENVPASDVDFDGNITGGAGIGYYVLPKLRTQLDFGYHVNDADGATGGFATSGELRVLSFLVSLYRDFPIGNNIRPFIGAGVGAARINPDFSLTPAVGAATGPDGADLNLAYQGTAGIAWDVTEKLSLETRYRYLRAGEYDFGTAQGDYANHSALAALRYNFGLSSRKPAPRQAPPAVAQAAPTPPPAPAPVEPAPEPVELLDLVFFPFNSADLTAEANAVLDKAARVIKDRGVERITLEGHTDTRGSADYNKRLATRRAQAVRQGLIERGIPGESMSISAKGESQLRDQTADEVKSQSNRFVRIIAIWR